jgi:hypothetical protein
MYYVCTSIYLTVSWFLFFTQISSLLDCVSNNTVINPVNTYINNTKIDKINKAYNSDWVTENTNNCKNPFIYSFPRISLMTLEFHSPYPSSPCNSWQIGSISGSPIWCPLFRVPNSWIQGPQFRVPNSGSPIQGPQFRVPNSGSPIQGPQFRVPNSGSPIQGPQFRVPNSGSLIQGPQFGVPNSGYLIWGPKLFSF